MSPKKYNTTVLYPLYVILEVLHCTKNPIYVLPEMKLGDLAPNSYIHVSVSDLYIPRIGLPIWLHQNKFRLNLGIYKSLTNT